MKIVIVVNLMFRLPAIINLVRISKKNKRVRILRNRRILKKIVQVRVLVKSKYRNRKRKRRKEGNRRRKKLRNKLHHKRQQICWEML